MEIVNSREWWEEYFAHQWEAFGGSEQTRHFMERLVAALPPSVAAFLSSRPLRILDWGCAFGEGVAVLAHAFPQSQVVGLDFASNAIEEARRRYTEHEFVWTESGEIPGLFDAIVVNNCLEHFENPLAVMRKHLRSCTELYIALVPHNEQPLLHFHRAQFTEGSFPRLLGSFRRLCVRLVDVDSRYWKGRQLLAVYGSQSFLQGRDILAEESRVAEQEKWDSYYAALPLVAEDPLTAALNAELVGRVSELVPAGGRILEAGCGGGWQSLALARTGAFRVTLMDVSGEALAYARRVFEREHLQADFIRGDVVAPGEPAFDLVFNVGVLEHYPSEQQVALLRGMASRSSRYVLALAPNQLCYWYWLWRIARAGHGEWPFGNEAPPLDLSPVVEAAGLRFLGHTYMGEAWVESFITNLPGMEGPLRARILEIHRSPLIPMAHKSYLVGALAGVSADASPLPRAWARGAASADSRDAELNAALADALALGVASERRLRLAQTQLQEKTEQAQREIDDLRKKLDDVLGSTWWKLGAPHRAGFTALRSLARRIIPLAARRRLSRLRQDMRATVRRPELAPLRPRISPGRRIDILCFPVIDWDFRFQRPQQLLTRFARDGHRVFYLRTAFTGLDKDCAEAHQVAEGVYQLGLPGEAGVIIYEDRLGGPTLGKALAALREFALREGVNEAVCLVHHPFWHPLAAALKEEYGWKIVYDCMDEHSGFQTIPTHVIACEASLLPVSDLVVATSKKLEQRLGQASRNCLLLPNAGDYDHFSNLPPRDASPLAWLPRPVIGYYGAIAEWFDAGAIRLAATRHPEWSFVLLGHTFGSELGDLAGRPNVHLVGEKAYAELPAYLVGFDVCTIPFVLSPLTEATNPVKVFEYLSAGKPVVAAALPELEPLAEVIQRYTTPEEFVALLERAITDDTPEQAAGRQAVARANTWDVRYQALKCRVDALYGKASIIVVTWNGLDYTRRCIESVLADRTWPNMELVVVDNASEDDTAEYLRGVAEREPAVKLILNDRNRGFAAANNLALQQTGDSAFVVLLNNDTVVPRGWLCRLLRHARRPEVGMVGPVTNWAGNEAKVTAGYADMAGMQSFAWAYIEAHDGRFFDIKVPAMYCVAMRRAVVDQVGLLDERFGVGMFEDDDYARRVRQAGYRVICAEDVFVHHYGMASFASLGEAEYRRLFERNRRAYEEKWGEPWTPHEGRG